MNSLTIVLRLLIQTEMDMETTLMHSQAMNLNGMILTMILMEIIWITSLTTQMNGKTQMAMVLEITLMHSHMISKNLLIVIMTLMAIIGILVHILTEIQQDGMGTLDVQIQMEMDGLIRMMISLMIQLKTLILMVMGMERMYQEITLMHALAKLEQVQQ